MEGSPVPFELTLNGINRDNLVFAVKWVASLIQILGYAATAFDLTPWNVYLFLTGVSGWFMVGLLWNDKAIILIHLVALTAMVAGLAS
jgi:hypothetical protein